RHDHREERHADRAAAARQARRGGTNPRRGGASADVRDGRALAREFLEQQRLLGGDWVILPTPGLRPGSLAPSESPAVLTPGASPGKPEGLPPAGLSYDPPGSDLFSNDPVSQAGSPRANAPPLLP